MAFSSLVWKILYILSMSWLSEKSMISSFSSVAWKSSLEKFVISLTLVFYFILELFISWISRKLGVWSDILSISLPLFVFFRASANKYIINKRWSILFHSSCRFNYAWLKQVRVHNIYKITDVYVIFIVQEVIIKVTTITFIFFSFEIVFKVLSSFSLKILSDVFLGCL